MNFQKYLLIDPINEWVQLFGKYNWENYTLIEISYENDVMTFGHEFTFIILGLGFRVRVNTRKSLKLFDKWDKKVKKGK